METTSASAVESLLGIFFDSDNVELLSQRLIHEFELLPGQPTGVFVFTVTARSELKYLGGFGSSSLTALGEISIWDEHPLCQAVRTRKPIEHKSTAALSENLICVPLTRGKVPNGVMVLQYRELPSKTEEDPVWSSITNMGGYFLALQGLALGKVSASTGESAAMPEELSTRQLEILKLIGDGLNNAEIAQKVLVSESTVRQETIKIYRILQVANRHEAMMKGRALGLIPSLSKASAVSPGLAAS